MSASATATYKVVVMGHHDSGKTKLVSSFEDDGDARRESPEAAPCVCTTAEVDGRKVHLDFADLSSNPEYAGIAPTHLRGARAVLLCFSRSATESIQELKEVWFPLVHEHDPDLLVILVAITASSSVEPQAPGYVMDSQVAALAQELGVSKWASVALGSPNEIKGLAMTIAEVCVATPATKEEAVGESSKKSTCNVA